jgi:hypothetical protein
MSAALGYSSFTRYEIAIDASGEKVGFVFPAPKTGNIDRVFAYVRTKTTNGTLDVRLETVDPATGKPSGTLVATNTSGTFANTASNQTIDVTLTAVCPVVKGTHYALVINQNAGNCTIMAISGPGNVVSGGMCSRLSTVFQNTGGSWSNRNAAPANAARPNFAVRYDDTNYYYIPGVVSLSTETRTGFNNTSGTRERGLAFTLPFPTRVTGFHLFGILAGGDYNVVLANTDGTALATYAGDKDLGSYYFVGSNYIGSYMGYFSSTVDLAAATKYYLTLVPTSASEVNLGEMTLISGASIPAQMGMWNGGTSAYLVTRASGGAYTEVTTERPYGMGLIVSAFDDGAGGGGGSTGISRGRIQLGM